MCSVAQVGFDVLLPQPLQQLGLEACVTMVSESKVIQCKFRRCQRSVGFLTTSKLKEWNGGKAEDKTSMISGLEIITLFFFKNVLSYLWTTDIIYHITLLATQRFIHIRESVKSTEPKSPRFDSQHRKRVAVQTIKISAFKTGTRFLARSGNSLIPPKIYHFWIKSLFLKHPEPSQTHVTSSKIVI